MLIQYEQNVKQLGVDLVRVLILIIKQAGLKKKDYLDH